MEHVIGSASLVPKYLTKQLFKFDAANEGSREIKHTLYYFTSVLYKDMQI